MSLRSMVKGLLTGRLDRKYERRLAAKQVSYEKWIEDQESLAAVEEQSVPAVEPQEEIWVFCAGFGKLASSAPKDILRFFRARPGVMIAYGDEDVLEKGSKRRSPWFKPEWSPDTFASFFYFGSVTAVRRSLLEKSSFWEEICKACPQAGKRKTNPVVCQYPDPETMKKWMSGLTILAGGFEKGAASIGCVHTVLFHCDEERKQKEYLAWEMKDSLNSAAEHSGLKGRYFPAVISGGPAAQDQRPRVSVIIPSKDNPGVLEQCLQSFLRTAGTVAYEILVVDNGSSKENRRAAEKLLAGIGGVAPGGNRYVRYLYHPMEFHFSKMCNLGAGQARGDMLLFLNDDVELSCENWLAEMMSRAVRPYAGAVGLKLYYPQGVRIQHAGITNLPMGPVHKLQFLPDDQVYYFGANRTDRNVIAVTGACLMVESRRFREAGGFCEELAVAFNDVDLCYTLYELGYHNVVLNGVFAYHHESLSRGDDESVQKQRRLAAERKRLYERHHGLEGRDPYYPEALNRDGLDTRIRPAYLTSGNVPQSISPRMESLGLEQYRMDQCLLLRVEYAGKDGIQGYSVVLGDDNACYEKSLVLCRVQEEGSCLEGMLIPLDEQYRPDLQENMQDQRNVALCGFRLKWNGTLPKGSYRIAAAARSRVTGLQLINWSSRTLDVD